MPRRRHLPSRRRSIVLALSITGAAGLGATSPPPSAPATTTKAEDLQRQVVIAQEAMALEDWSEALEAWEAAQAIAPDRAELSYNRGVAAYRAGRLTDAAEAFRRAATLGDADLAARAMYNEGTVRFAEALQQLEAPPRTMPADSESSPPPLKDTIERVGSSLNHFRDAIDADPSNRDARANAELAHRLLRQLEEIQEQQQQQQQQNQDQNSDQEQEQGQGQDQNQDQRPPQSEGEEPDRGEKSPEEAEEGDPRQEQPSPSDDPPSSEPNSEENPAGDEEDESEGDTGDERSKQAEDSQADRSEDSSSDAEADSETETKTAEESLTREEAERLLQSVRDKERQRRRAKARQEKIAPKAPVEKDW